MTILDSENVSTKSEQHSRPIPLERWAKEAFRATSNLQWCLRKNPDPSELPADIVCAINRDLIELWVTIQRIRDPMDSWLRPYLQTHSED
jgi:hypothetical protein